MSERKCLSILRSKPAHTFQTHVEQTDDSPSSEGKLYSPTSQQKVFAARAVNSDV
jgi:hypothetical protein